MKKALFSGIVGYCGAFLSILSFIMAANIPNFELMIISNVFMVIFLGMFLSKLNVLDAYIIRFFKRRSRRRYRAEKVERRLRREIAYLKLQRTEDGEIDFFAESSPAYYTERKAS